MHLPYTDCAGLFLEGDNEALRTFWMYRDPQIKQVTQLLQGHTDVL